MSTYIQQVQNPVPMLSTNTVIDKINKSGKLREVILDLGDYPTSPSYYRLVIRNLVIFDIIAPDYPSVSNRNTIIFDDIDIKVYDGDVIIFTAQNPSFIPAVPGLLKSATLVIDYE